MSLLTTKPPIKPGTATPIPLQTLEVKAAEGVNLVPGTCLVLLYIENSNQNTLG